MTDMTFAHAFLVLVIGILLFLVYDSILERFRLKYTCLLAMAASASSVTLYIAVISYLRMLKF